MHLGLNLILAGTFIHLQNSSSRKFGNKQSADAPILHLPAFSGLEHQYLHSGYVARAPTLSHAARITVSAAPVVALRATQS